LIAGERSKGKGLTEKKGERLTKETGTQKRNSGGPCE